MKNPLRSVFDWFYDRLALSQVVTLLRTHKVPAETATGKKAWMYVLGSATLLMFAMQLVSGVALVTVYVPSPATAYESLHAITNTFTLGWLVRALHFYGASAMMVLVALHAARVFLTGSYKFPREMNWISGVFLLLLTASMAFTGQLLRWDQNGIWSVVVASKFLLRVPWIGRELADFALAGESVGGATLSRFFALHVFILPGLLILLIGAHLFLLYQHGVSEPPRAGRKVEPRRYRQWYAQLKEQGRHYWPYMVWREALFGFVCVALVFTLAVTFGPKGPGAAPDPMVLNADPRPDWYFLWYYALLWIKDRGLEALVMVYGPIAVVALLLLLPLVASKGERSPARRPWAVAAVLAVALAFAVLTSIGVRAPWAPAEDARPLSAAVLPSDQPGVLEGAHLFYDRGCQLCHKVLGTGGAYGPDLTHVQRRLSPEEIAVRTVNGVGDMPSYRETLSASELDRIVEFLLSVGLAERGS